MNEIQPIFDFQLDLSDFYSEQSPSQITSQFPTRYQFTTSNNIYLQNLSFKDFSINTEGGSILYFSLSTSETNKVLITGVLFSNCYTSGNHNGGAIYFNHNGFLIISKVFAEECHPYISWSIFIYLFRSFNKSIKFLNFIHINYSLNWRIIRIWYNSTFYFFLSYIKIYKYFK
jgi:hypothetical protein